MAEYIEREALLAWFGDYKANDPHEYLSPQHIIDDIAEIPSADVVPVVHGRWVNKTNPSRAIVEQRVDCSACGHIFWHTSAMSYNYCPNCGARMGDE